MGAPLLQIALDVTSRADALGLAARVYPHFDILEAGTPLLLSEGVAVLEALRSTCPGKRLLADLKIMDAGRLEASLAFDRGADIVSVLAVADDSTIRGALQAASERGGSILADLINTPDPLGRARELEAMGVHALCVHTAHDAAASGRSPLHELAALRPVTRALLAVAGGLALESAVESVTLGADIVVVGASVLGAPDPTESARSIRAAMARAAEVRE